MVHVGDGKIILRDFEGLEFIEYFLGGERGTPKEGGGNTNFSITVDSGALVTPLLRGDIDKLHYAMITPPSVIPSPVRITLIHRINLSSIKSAVISPETLEVNTQVRAKGVKAHIEISETGKGEGSETCTRACVIVDGVSVKSCRKGIGRSTSLIVDNISDIVGRGGKTHTSLDLPTTQPSPISKPSPAILLFVTLNSLSVSFSTLLLTSTKLHMSHLSLPPSPGSVVFAHSPDSTNVDFKGLALALIGKSGKGGMGGVETKVEATLEVTTDKGGVVLVDAPYSVTWGEGRKGFVAYKIEGGVGEGGEKAIGDAIKWVKEEISWFCGEGSRVDREIMVNGLFEGKDKIGKRRREEIVGRIEEVIREFEKRVEENERSWKEEIEKTEGEFGGRQMRENEGRFAPRPFS